MHKNLTFPSNIWALSIKALHTFGKKKWITKACVDNSCVVYLCQKIHNFLIFLKSKDVVPQYAVSCYRAYSFRYSEHSERFLDQWNILEHCAVFFRTCSGCSRSRCSAPANRITTWFKMAERRIVFQCERTMFQKYSIENRTVKLCWSMPFKHSRTVFQNTVHCSRTSEWNMPIQNRL